MAQYKIGTVSVTNGSATVTGSGTTWLSNISSGNYTVIAGDSVAYQVASVASNTSITLTAPYGGTTGTGRSYVAHIDFHPNGAPEFEDGDTETAAILNRWLGTEWPSASFGTAATRDVIANSTDTTAGRVLTVGAYSWGGSTTLPPSNDLQQITGSSNVWHTDSSTLNGPPVAGNYQVIVLNRLDSGLNTLQFGSGLAINRDNDRTYRFRVSSGNWTWQELYHTGNLNTLEFGGSASDVAFEGTVQSASTVVFLLPINLYAIPSSITISSTFRITNLGGTVNFATGYNSFSLSAASGSRIAYLIAAGLSGLTVGERVLAFAETSTSKITVNP